MRPLDNRCANMLWFDVERRYKTILGSVFKRATRLWFDVERRYKTMVASSL